MTDQNVNKIDVRAQVDSAAPFLGPTPAVARTLPPNLPDSAETLATSDVMPIANPFVDVAALAPLEADLCDLAAHYAGVQLKEMHHIHLGTPAPTSLAVQPGSRDQVGAHRDGSANHTYYGGNGGAYDWGIDDSNGASTDTDGHHPSGDKRGHG